MTPTELLKWNQSVPRYTSYPTVPHWGEISSKTTVQATESIDGPIELYVHVPFCEDQCTYCGCNMVVARRKEAGKRYLDTLQEHIHALPLPRQSMPVNRVHLGGGTPTWLTNPQIKRLMDMIATRFEWDSTAEVSIEIDPGTVDPDRITYLRSLGFNRVSFGVQSLDSTVLCAVARPQQSQSVNDTISASLAAGFSVGVDLMCGLPHQDRQSVLDSLKLVSEWGVHRVALFAYAHLPELKPNQASFDPSTLPDPLTRIHTQLDGRDLLLGEGFRMVGMDHFARQGDPLFSATQIHRNFMGYTTQAAAHLIGLGPSAISEVNNVYWQNPSKLAHWYQGHGPTRGHVMTEEDKRRASFIEQAMCQLRIPLSPQIRLEYASAIAQLERISQTDSVSVTESEIRIHEPMMARLVAKAFDGYELSGHFSNAM